MKPLMKKNILKGNKIVLGNECQCLYSGLLMSYSIVARIDTHALKQTKVRINTHLYSGFPV